MDLYNIDLSSKKEVITIIGKEIFDQITNLPESIRPDDKKRTGIMILAKRANSRNLILVKVYEPSEAASYFVVEKAVRSEILRQNTSQNSEDESMFKFPGSITVTPEVGVHYQVSVSGLQGHEDVAVAILVMSEILGWGVDGVISNIKQKSGQLPIFLNNPNHFLTRMLREFN